MAGVPGMDRLPMLPSCSCRLAAAARIAMLSGTYMQSTSNTELSFEVL